MPASDWPTTVRQFERLFGARRSDRRTGLPGFNLLTPDRLGTVNVEGAPVEISAGIGFGGDRIYGVTFPRLPGGRVDERDQCCWELTEVYEYLYGEPPPS